MTTTNNCFIMGKEIKKIGCDTMSKELITTKMNVNNKLVRVMRVDNVDYISLTDLAKYQNENDVKKIENWEELISGLPQTIITYGFDPSFDYYAADISYDENACGQFTVMHHGEELMKVHLGVPGEHNISNALASIALISLMKLPQDALLWEHCGRSHI